jgi:purine nucleosidase
MRRIIIDCDPGQDDAVNLFLAMSSPDELEILGITVVAGNVPLALTEVNARLMCDIAGRGDIPVFAGCDRPMVRELVTAEHVHGSTGINGVEVTEPEHPLQEQHAADFIVETLKAAGEETVTLVPTGPLTNIAVAFQKAPEVVPKVKEIVLMGGAMRESGNMSPSAEFNMLADPHAAAIVFDCGRPITQMGLDVSHQVLTTRERIERLKEIDNGPARATVGMLDFFNRHDMAKYNYLGAPLHDPCTVAFLLKPEIFETKLCNVTVETESELTIGHTSVDFWQVTKRPKNVNWAWSVDADAFYALLTERLARFE